MIQFTIKTCQTSGDNIKISSFQLLISDRRKSKSSSFLQKGKSKKTNRNDLVYVIPLQELLGNCGSVHNHNQRNIGFISRCPIHGFQAQRSELYDKSRPKTIKETYETMDQTRRLPRGEKVKLPEERTERSPKSWTCVRYM